MSQDTLTLRKFYNDASADNFLITTYIKENPEAKEFFQRLTDDQFDLFQEIQDSDSTFKTLMKNPNFEKRFQTVDGQSRLTNEQVKIKALGEDATPQDIEKYKNLNKMQIEKDVMLNKNEQLKEDYPIGSALFPRIAKQYSEKDDDILNYVGSGVSDAIHIIPSALTAATAAGAEAIGSELGIGAPDYDFLDTFSTSMQDLEMKKEDMPENEYVNAINQIGTDLMSSIEQYIPGGMLLKAGKTAKNMKHIKKILEHPKIASAIGNLKAKREKILGGTNIAKNLVSKPALDVALDGFDFCNLSVVLLRLKRRF